MFKNRAMKFFIFVIIFLPQVSFGAAYLDVGSMQNDLSVYTLNDLGEIKKEDLKTNFINMNVMALKDNF